MKCKYRKKCINYKEIARTCNGLKYPMGGRAKPDEYGYRCFKCV